MLKKIIYIVIVFSSFLLDAKSFSYNTIHQFPTCIEKDYYIWNCLKDGNTTKEQAQKIIKEISRSNGYLKKAYKEKTGEEITEDMIKPVDKLNVPRRNNTRSTIDIFDSFTQKEKIAQKKINKKALESFFANKNKEDRWQEKSLASEIYVFNKSGPINRQKYFDKNLSSAVVKKLATYKCFNKSISIIFKENLPLLKKSLLSLVTGQNSLSSLNHFRLGIYAIEEKKYTVAQNYFYYSATRAQTQWRKDKANFWHYLISKDIHSLDKLLKSTHVNIYTLIAHDFKNKEYEHIKVPKFIEKHKPGFNIKSPISWAKIKREINNPNTDLMKLANQFRYEDTVGIYSLIKAQAENYTTSYFPMPYREYMQHFPKEKQALMYAIARQETRFIPASVSPTFALGMMQFMPFLMKEISEKKSEKLESHAMFDPEKALEYGSYHLDYLTKRLHHPMFIGYAYNGGIGFTRKLLKDKHYFKKGDFEPYLSMERIDNVESREYGKRILVNYVVYMNQLGVKTRISTLINMLMYPSKTDKYRVREKVKIE